MKLRHRHEVSRQSFTKSAQNRLSLRGRTPRRCGAVFVRKPALQLDRGRYYFPRCAPLRAAPSPLVRQTAWHTRGENMEGATPPFSGASAPRGGESNFIPNFTLTPLPRGGRSLSSDPYGKAEMPIQEASASMPKDSSDWMPKASMTSAGASISSSGPCMSRAWAKSSSVSAVKIRAPMAATIRSSTDWG